ncbi:MAG: cell division protein FtsZ [Candidatus Aenigmarchaeota archaeon]|nr:cell division protein FtsZ [Candidatus Aenigmarchaeota archaeon]
MAAGSEGVDNFEVQKARIMVIGVGGGGNNTVSALATRGVSGATTVVMNTDANHLSISKADHRLLIGKNLTKGLGAGGYPQMGKDAALESKNEIRELLQGVDLVFLTCGLGGGTGTGATPVVGRIAKECGAIVIAAVTLPFKLEGARMGKAEEGLAELRKSTDTVIAIENQRLLQIGGKMPLKQAFSVADDLFATMIKGITETISEPSLVNLDYADVRALMRAGGVAMIGIGISDSDNRAEEAINFALNNPLLDVDYTGAAGALIQVIGGEDLKLEEITKIGERVQQHLDPNAQCMWGARILPEYKHKIQVITIITGVKSPFILGKMQEKSPNQQKMSKQLGIEML